MYGMEICGTALDEYTSFDDLCPVSCGFCEESSEESIEDEPSQESEPSEEPSEDSFESVEDCLDNDNGLSA